MSDMIGVIAGDCRWTTSATPNSIEPGLSGINERAMMNKYHCLRMTIPGIAKACGALVLSVALFAIASGQGLIQDGPNRNFNQNPQANNGQLPGQNFAVQPTTRVIEVMDNGRKIKIEIEPNGSIRMAVTRQYSSAGLDAIARRIPELEQPLRNFPTVVGDQEIEITVGVTTNFTAVSAANLQQQDAAAFDIYSRFLRAADQQRARGQAQGGQPRGFGGQQNVVGQPAQRPGQVRPPGWGVPSRPQTWEPAERTIGGGRNGASGMIKDSESQDALNEGGVGDTRTVEEGIEIRDSGGR